MAKYQLDERGRIECPKTGKAVNPYNHCQSRKHGTVCEHYGFFYGERCFVCRYTRERELRVHGNNGNYAASIPYIPKTIK